MRYFFYSKHWLLYVPYLFQALATLCLLSLPSIGCVMPPISSKHWLRYAPYLFQALAALCPLSLPSIGCVMPPISSKHWLRYAPYLFQALAALSPLSLPSIGCVMSPISSNNNIVNSYIFFMYNVQCTYINTIDFIIATAKRNALLLP